MSNRFMLDNIYWATTLLGTHESKRPHRDLMFQLKKLMRNLWKVHVYTSKNQSYRAKKSGRPNKSETAPSAIGIDPRFPPLNKLVRRLLALSSRFLFVLGSSVRADWHLQKHFNTNCSINTSSTTETRHKNDGEFGWIQTGLCLLS